MNKLMQISNAVIEAIANIASGNVKTSQLTELKVKLRELEYSNDMYAAQSDSLLEELRLLEQELDQASDIIIDLSDQVAARNLAMRQILDLISSFI